MALGKDVSNLRKDYQKHQLDRSDVAADPIKQFESWFAEAVASNSSEANAMSLATVKDGRPSVRVVLLKGFDERGFTFFTNYESRKGQEMADTPQACLNFWWPELERQVRIEGAVERLSAAESDAYYQSRGRGSRLGAWASPQSQVIADREQLETKVTEIEQQFEGEETFPRPKHWGGYLVRPDYVEFWQGRSSRLHDRLVYTRKGDQWEIARLAP